MSAAVTSSAPQVSDPQIKENSAARFYRPELDVLRFFAFLGVFVFHALPRIAKPEHAAGLPHWLVSVVLSVAGAGVYGVDLFFALSAYLITTLLLREREVHGDVDIRSFYIRRILRIWPLYFGFLAFSIVLAHIPSTGQVLPFRYIVGYCLLVGNWIFAIYGLTTFSSVAAVLWTVSIEEQFYLLWPLAMRRASVRRMAAIAIGILIVDSIYRVVIAASDFSLMMMKNSTFTRIDPIALGILLALFADKIPPLARWQRVALLLAGLFCWPIAYAFCFSDRWRLTVSYPVIALSCIAILVSVLGSQHALLKNRLLVYLGKISYGLYVLHLFVIWYADRTIHSTKPLAMLAVRGLSLVFTVLLAAASYRWLESPFLRLKERLSYVPSRPV